MLSHGPLTKYVKSWVAHALGMPGTFIPTADFKIIHLSGCRDKYRKSIAYINHSIVNDILNDYCQHPVEDNQCLKRVGHHRPSLPPSVRHPKTIYIPIIWHLTNGPNQYMCLPTSPVSVKATTQQLNVLYKTGSLKFDRHSGSSAIEMPVKFQSDTIIITSNLVASTLHAIWLTG